MKGKLILWASVVIVAILIGYFVVLPAIQKAVAPAKVLTISWVITDTNGVQHVVSSNTQQGAAILVIAGLAVSSVSLQATYTGSASSTLCPTSGCYTSYNLGQSSTFTMGAPTSSSTLQNPTAGQFGAGMEILQINPLISTTLPVLCGTAITTTLFATVTTTTYTIGTTYQVAAITPTGSGNNVLTMSSATALTAVNSGSCASANGGNFVGQVALQATAIGTPPLPTSYWPGQGSLGFSVVAGTITLSGSVGFGTT